MLRLERRQRILAALAAQGGAGVAELAARLGVTVQTVRRDLTRLEAEGLVVREHGGARLSGHSARDEDTPLYDRLGEAAERKRSIGRLAAALVQPGQTVIFDAGTTTLAVAAALHAPSDLTVITNALPVAAELSRHPGVEVVMAGGMVRPSTQSTVGAAARQAFSGVNADLLFLGAAGMSVPEGLTNTNLLEAEVKRAMIGAARRVVLVAHGAKLGQVQRYSFAEWTDVDLLITDQGAPPELLAQLREKGVAIRLSQIS